MFFCLFVPLRTNFCLNGATGVELTFTEGDGWEEESHCERKDRAVWSTHAADKTHGVSRTAVAAAAAGTGGGSAGTVVGSHLQQGVW